ncbi:MAG: sulfatase-like hydrolase/transferase [Planctomycetota bacterium]
MAKDEITRRDFVKTTTTLAAGAAALARQIQAQDAKPKQGDPKRPNILFLFSDQHNAKCMGVAGHPDAKTPALDQLAKEGVMFSRAFCQNPICTPSRTSFLSGLYCHNHGHYGNGGPQPFPMLSLFAHAKAHGYRTGAFGKLHTPENWIEPHLDVDCDYMKKGNGGYTDWITARGKADLRDDGTIPEWSKLKRGGQPLDARAARLPFEEVAERYYTDRLIEFMRSQPDGQPFCAWLTLMRPHEAYIPTKEFWDLYDEKTITLPPNADDPLTDKSPQTQNKLGQRKADIPMWIFEPRNWEEGRKRVLRGYLGSVSMMDACLGLVMKELKALGMDENTIVIYSADHGDFAGEHGIIEKAPGLAYDAITRIPMIWRWPDRIGEGKVCEELVESVDFLPTVCALAGLPVPKQCDGYDLAPMLKGEAKPVREAAFTECPWGKCVRTKDWKLAHYPRRMYPDDIGEVGELYDMANDPWEMKNLFKDPAQKERIAELRQTLLDWLITTDHPITVSQSAAQFDPEWIAKWKGKKTRPRFPSQTEGLGEDQRVPWQAIDRAAKAKAWGYL